METIRFVKVWKLEIIVIIKFVVVAISAATSMRGLILICNLENHFPPPLHRESFYEFLYIDGTDGEQRFQVSVSRCFQDHISESGKRCPPSCWLYNVQDWVFHQEPNGRIQGMFRQQHEEHFTSNQWIQFQVELASIRFLQSRDGGSASKESVVGCLRCRRLLSLFYHYRPFV